MKKILSLLASIVFATHSYCMHSENTYREWYRAQSLGAIGELYDYFEAVEKKVTISPEQHAVMHDYVNQTYSGSGAAFYAINHCNTIVAQKKSSYQRYAEFIHFVLQKERRRSADLRRLSQNVFEVGFVEVLPILESHHLLLPELQNNLICVYIDLLNEKMKKLEKNKEDELIERYARALEKIIAQKLPHTSAGHVARVLSDSFHKGYKSIAKVLMAHGATLLSQFVLIPKHLPSVERSDTQVDGFKSDEHKMLYYEQLDAEITKKREALVTLKKDPSNFFSGMPEDIFNSILFYFY